MTTLRRRVRAVLKRLRAAQPFNAMITTAVRAALATTGTRSEFAVRHLHRFGRVRDTLPNGRTLVLWSQADDWVSNLVFWEGWQAYEPETVRLFFELARRARVTVDVGAFVGYYALLAGHANPAARVLALEPFPETFARLRANVALNALDNIECIAAAAGDQEGTADFFASSGGLPCSSSLSYAFMKGTPDIRSTRVVVVALDRLLVERNVQRVDLVKLDTETTEVQALRGMSRTLERDQPTLICEVLRGRGVEQDLEALLRTFGYRFYLLTPDGPEEREHIEGHPEWLNYLFSVGPPDNLPRESA
jgi:FkbM family methyltransferase